MTWLSGSPSYTAKFKSPSNGVLETRPYVNEPSFTSFLSFLTFVLNLFVSTFFVLLVFSLPPLPPHAESSNVETASVLNTLKNFGLFVISSTPYPFLCLASAERRSA